MVDYHFSRSNEDRRSYQGRYAVALEKENIESRQLWKPMHVQPVFKEFSYHAGKAGGGIV